MTLEEAIIHLEDMYIDIDEEAERLCKEESDLQMVARTDRRALAVALETLYVLKDQYPAP